MRWWVQEGNVPNLGSAPQSTVALNEIIIWDAELIWLNGVFLIKRIVLLSRELEHFLRDPTPKGNICALKLTMVTNEVAL